VLGRGGTGLIAHAGGTTATNYGGIGSMSFDNNPSSPSTSGRYGPRLLVDMDAIRINGYRVPENQGGATGQTGDTAAVLTYEHSPVVDRAWADFDDGDVVCKKNITDYVAPHSRPKLIWQPGYYSFTNQNFRGLRLGTPLFVRDEVTPILGYNETTSYTEEGVRTGLNGFADYGTNINVLDSNYAEEYCWRFVATGIMSGPPAEVASLQWQQWDGNTWNQIGAITYAGVPGVIRAEAYIDMTGLTSENFRLAIKTATSTAYVVSDLTVTVETV